MSRFKLVTRGVGAAVEGALAGWTISERLDEQERLHAIGIGAALLLPLLWRKKAVELSAALGLAILGYALHHMMQQDRYKVLAGPVEAAEAPPDPSLN